MEVAVAVLEPASDLDSDELSDLASVLEAEAVSARESLPEPESELSFFLEESASVSVPVREPLP